MGVELPAGESTLPVETGAQPHSLADDDDRRRFGQRRGDPISPNVETTTCCSGVLALLTIATGSSGRRPPAISRAAITGKCFSAM